MERFKFMVIVSFLVYGTNFLKKRTVNNLKMPFIYVEDVLIAPISRETYTIDTIHTYIHTIILRAETSC